MHIGLLNSCLQKYSKTIQIFNCRSPKDVIISFCAAHLKVHFIVNHEYTLNKKTRHFMK